MLGFRLSLTHWPVRPDGATGLVTSYLVRFASGWLVCEPYVAAVRMAALPGAVTRWSSTNNSFTKALHTCLTHSLGRWVAGLLLL